MIGTETKLLVLLSTNAAILFLYLLGLAICRLYLSPLARFPGPKLAALTRWYETYLDAFKFGGGMYIWEVEKMHKKYGL
jgi:hypothetical protein